MGRFQLKNGESRKFGCESEKKRDEGARVKPYPQTRVLLVKKDAQVPWDIPIRTQLYLPAKKLKMTRQ